MKKIIKLSVLLLLISANLSVMTWAQGRLLNKKNAGKLEQPAGTNAGQEATTPSPTPKGETAQAVAPRGNLAQPTRLQVMVLDQFLGQLDLAAEQKVKLRTVRTQHIRQIRSLIELERAQARVYDEVLFSDEFDAKIIEKRATDLAETRAELIKAQAKMFIEVRQVLTPEQFAKLRQLMEDERARRPKNPPLGQP